MRRSGGQFPNVSGVGTSYIYHFDQPPPPFLEVKGTLVVQTKPILRRVWKSTRPRPRNVRLDFMLAAGMKGIALFGEKMGS